MQQKPDAGTDPAEASAAWRRLHRLRPTRKALRRRVRRIESVTLRHAHTFIVKRWENVRLVRRHAIGWMVLVGLLIAQTGLQVVIAQTSYSVNAPDGGGVYAEAVVGPLGVINPILASTSAERSASKLVFAGLFGYDQYNRLRSELATGWTVENGGKRYIVSLDSHASWHDGKPVTADDVVFTVTTIKNPRTRSQLYSSWAGISVAKLAVDKVAFDLPAPYAPFPHALTFGLLPRHILATVSPEQLREHSFNRNPIGTGPFMFNHLQIINPSESRSVLYLDANRSYIRGTPKLATFQLHVYKDHDAVKKAFEMREVTAATDVDSADLAEIARVQGEAKVARASLYNGVYAFLRNDSTILSDVQVRSALRLATDRQAIVKALDTASPLEGPLLNEQYDFLFQKRQPAFNMAEAARQLDAASWVRSGPGGVRQKAGASLRLTVVAPRSGDYPRVLELVAKNWRELGVDVDTQMVAADSIQQNVLLPRAYDVFIYELAIGADPDVYAYWHSSQADPRGLNLSSYRSGKADEALVSAQSRSEDALRQLKYEAFVDQWLADVPAVALYQPNLHYVTTPSARSLAGETNVVNAIDRYRLVEQWTVEKRLQFKTP